MTSSVCDCCNEPLTRSSGYLLSTTSIVLSVAHWESRFKLVKAMADPLGFDERQKLGIFGSTLHTTAESRTPWLVCEDCIGLFVVDRDEARSYARRGIDPPGTGAVEPGGCAQYAAIAWEIVFGRWPASVQQPDVVDECDFCGRTVYRNEHCAKIGREAVDRLRATGVAEVVPLGSMRPGKKGWLACMRCTTRIVAALRASGG